MPTACARCGKDPADGLATINDDRYCHGEETPSCYEIAQQTRDNAFIEFNDDWARLVDEAARSKEGARQLLRAIVAEVKLRQS